MSGLLGRAVQACPHCHHDILLEIVSEHLTYDDKGNCIVDVTYTADSRMSLDHHSTQRCLP